MKVVSNLHSPRIIQSVGEQGQDLATYQSDRLQMLKGCWARSDPCHPVWVRNVFSNKLRITATQYEEISCVGLHLSS
jgi:hypothetical protein